VSLTVRGENASRSTVLGAAANRICFLTGVFIHDDNDEDDYSYCFVFVSGGNWHMNAYTQADDRGDTECSAQCLSW
jgi:hypothetical protein